MFFFLRKEINFLRRGRGSCRDVWDETPAAVSVSVSAVPSRLPSAGMVPPAAVSARSAPVPGEYTGQETGAAGRGVGVEAAVTPPLPVTPVERAGGTGWRWITLTRQAPCRGAVKGKLCEPSCLGWPLLRRVPDIAGTGRCPIILVDTPHLTRRVCDIWRFTCLTWAPIPSKIRTNERLCL